MAIDYGSKKCGVAVSDPLRIIATGLDTIATEDLIDFVKDYFEQEPVGTLVLGESLHKDGTPTNIHSHAVGFSRKMAKLYPDLEIEWQDEFNTSQRAKAIMFESLPKKKRQEKERVDKIAAVLILQDFMEANR